MRALIVDDEAPARAKLRLWLEKEPGVVVGGECADGLSAAQAIIGGDFDVVFLDVQMPGLNGLQVAAQLDPESAPLLIFVTAHDAHALAAFDLDAVDYLLKPYDEERFRRTLHRARERLRAPEHRIAAIRVARGQAGYCERLLVSAGSSGLRMLDVQSIQWIEADDNYVDVHVGDTCYVLRRSLRDLLRQLGEHRFVRIHKSAAVNLAQIEVLSPLSKGDYEVRLRNGRLLRLSRRYSASLFRRTGR